MKKVLFVFNHPATYKVKLLNELAKYLDLTVIFEREKTGGRNNEFYSEHKYNFKTVPIKHISLGDENVISSGVKKHIKKNHYDLIIMNGYRNFAEMSAIKWMKKHNVEFVQYINGGIIHQDEPKWVKRIKTKYISGAKYYMSPDERSNEYLVYYGADKDKIFNYPYSTIYEKEILSNKPTKEEIAEVRKEYNLEAKNIFVSCGQLIERKNYLELVNKWAEIEKENELIIVGEGPQKEQIESLINEKKIPNVRLLGYLSHENLFKLYKASKAFVFPSKEDIYGHVVNEAFSQGLPVICLNNVNSGVHLIHNKVNGFVLENINSQSFIDAINYVLSHDMFDEAIKTAKANTIEKMVEVNLKIIEENE